MANYGDNEYNITSEMMQFMLELIGVNDFEAI